MSRMCAAHDATGSNRIGNQSALVEELLDVLEAVAEPPLEPLVLEVPPPLVAVGSALAEPLSLALLEVSVLVLLAPEPESVL